MVLVVLGLDAVTVRLGEYFGCENLLLDVHTKMQAIPHRLEHPHTGKAWPSIATSFHPTEHGMTGHGELGSQFLAALSRVAHTLNVSGNIWSRIGDAIKQNTGQDWNLQIVDERTFLDGEHRAVNNWPGVYRNEALHYIWGLFEEVKEDRVSEETLIRETYTEAASKFRWVHEAITHDIEVAATHIPVNDVAGRRPWHPLLASHRIDDARLAARTRPRRQRVGRRPRSGDRPRADAGRHSGRPTPRTRLHRLNVSRAPDTR